jgi:catechol 2,3-dioxygenase-like lactoylglutathione lyase family enzyme
MKIHHFAIEVSNIDRSAEFYVQKLGFRMKTPKKSTEDGLYTYMNLDLGAAELELIEIKGKKKRQHKQTPPMCPHIGLETDDFERDLDLLKKRGISIFDGPHIIPNDVKFLTILDPDQYRIDIGQLI